jgi:hypothetical protein
MWASGTTATYAVRPIAMRLRAKHVFRPTMRDRVSSEGVPIQVARLRAVRLVTGVLLDLTIECTGGKGSGSHQLGLAVRPDHLAGCENMKLSVRYFNGYFLVTGPDTEPAKFKTCQQALTWCAAHYLDLPIKELVGKRRAANKPASPVRPVGR